MIAADATGASAAPLIGRRPGPLRSLWIGGFEGADHLNRHGRPLAMSAATGHDDRLEAGYDRLVRLGVRAVRESVGWRLAERDGRFDSARLDRILTLSPREAPVYTPINEISFLWWALSPTSLMHPFDSSFGERRGYETERRLAHATIDAIRAVDARARFMLTDSLICAHAAHPAQAADAARIHDFQHQAFDIVAGRAEPRPLAGNPRPRSSQSLPSTSITSKAATCPP